MTTRAERYALRIEVGGFLVSTAPVPHGSISTYQNWGCHCGDCRKAWRTYMRRWRDGET